MIIVVGLMLWILGSLPIGMAVGAAMAHGGDQLAEPVREGEPAAA